MGEIGLNRKEYLYDLQFWEMLLISRGYDRRHRDMWSATRWQTFYLMSVSMCDLKKAGIYRPTDLIRFPWDNNADEPVGNMPTKKEIEEMRRMMIEENIKNEAK